MKKKKKGPSLATLKNKLDSLVSRYVRLSAADDNGYAICVSCGKVEHWKDMDCGHFVGRRATAIRWDLRNLHPQCRGCNRFSADHLIGYTLWMQSHFGQDVVEDLIAAKHKSVIWRKGDLEEKIDEFADKLASLAMGKVESLDEWVRNHIS